jgi:hypothetical protein
LKRRTVRALTRAARHAAADPPEARFQRVRGRASTACNLGQPRELGASDERLNQCTYTSFNWLRSVVMSR